MTKKTKNSQLNSGFTLLEVLVAVIILAIVCIPVFRAFVTSANTTAKSKFKMRATNAAENLMEDIQHLTVDELQTKYGAMVEMTSSDAGYNVNSAALGKSKASYKITLNASNPAFDDDLNKALDDGYVATIILDPSWYTNTNRVNMPEFAAVSTSTAAIFSLAPTVETEVCHFFAVKNAEYRATSAGASAPVLNESDFAAKIRREIRVDIVDKGGYVLDEDGNQVPKVTVDVSVSYLVNDSNLVDDMYRTKKAVSRQIFSSAVTKHALNSVFIMYDPMYDCSEKYSDIITVHNKDKVETNLYVCAQNIEANATKFKDYISSSGKDGLILEIYEGTVDDGKGGSKQPITLRTNVIDSSKVEYLRDETMASDRDHIVPIGAYVNISSSDPVSSTSTIFNSTTYNKLVNNKGSFADKDDSKALNAQALDGKTLDASTIEDRIYDVRIKVEKPAASATDWPVSVELTGSYVPEVKDN